MARHRVALETSIAMDCVLAAEAALLLVLLRVGLRMLSFATLRRMLTHYASPGLAPRGLRADHTVSRVAWAVTAAARRLPLRTSCLEKALAAESMLRRRGFAPELRIGVREPGFGATPLDAHAWVECAGSVVVGGLANLPDYAVFSGPKHE